MSEGRSGVESSPHGELMPLDETWLPPHRRVRKVSHVLAADLRRRILSGELEEGRRLPPEADLTVSLEVSRDTLREALRILESQSLIEIRRGRGGGAVVRRPGLASVSRYVALLLQVRQATLADLEEARSLIEPPAAGQSAERLGREELDYLVTLHETERSAEGNALAFATAVAAFDQAVTELSGNRSIGVIAGVLRDIYAGQVYAAVGGSDARSAERVARRVVVAHSGFLEAARRRDGALAKDAWSDYLYSAGRQMVSRSRSRRPIDVVPLWRARADQAGGENALRAAASVATEIRSRIADGRLRDGERLPSLAELSKEFGISRPTLREALRILETEFLLDLRPGDRGGATVRDPSPRVAAQLAGTVFETRRTTLADFSRALRMVEPAMMGLAASRASAGLLKTMRALESDLAACVDDTPRFVRTWRRAVLTAFAGTRNPALTVIGQMLQWVRAGTGPAVTAGATGLPWVATTNRNAQRMFAELVSSLAAHDAARAGAVWAECLEVTSPFIEASDLGRRLMVDLIE
ncbi:FadR/GntR family transcriptional regulator [Spirillospora sp. CA-255316]